MIILDALLNGITQGAMIALVALGYTMVYGVLKLINFAHSEVFMMSAYVGLFCIARLGGAASPLLAGGVGTAAAMGFAAALGMSVLVQNLAQLLFTAQFRPYPQLMRGTVDVGVTMSTSRLLVLTTSVVVMVALEIVVKRTWFGKAMRALSTNEEAARLMGVRTSRVIATTFALGSSLAALGAVLYCLDQSQVYPTMSTVIGTRAFVAAVLGGIGSITGAMLGGLLLGVIGELVKLTDYSGGVDVLVFVVLIAVLLVRPAGLLGRAGIEKV